MSTVSLAILQCTGIKIVNTHPITYLEAAPTAETSLPDSLYEISGQILSLVPFDESQNSANISWAWVAEFVAFESAKSEQASATDAPAHMRHLSLTVDGHLVLPLTSADLKQVTLEEILNIPRSIDTESEKTWLFSDSQLEAMGTVLLERVKEEEVRLKFPVYGAVKEGRYPYEAAVTDGRSPFVLQMAFDLSTHLICSYNQCHAFNFAFLEFCCSGGSQRQPSFVPHLSQEYCWPRPPESHGEAHFAFSTRGS
ncbi:hypothetical protein B0H14DRAFT_3060930 [Mycena olivaceomarginata]|nr:hypothetical protein B0H14DRAFT_3060930 [Mycena olivaceomarginata]